MLGRVAVAIAVTNDEAVSAGQVEYHEVVKFRGVGTCFVSAVPELDDKADRGEGRLLKVAAVPFLGHVSCGYTQRAPAEHT